MRIKRPTRFDLCEKIFTRKMVIPRTWIRKEVVFCSSHGKPQGEWDRVAELMMIKFSEKADTQFSVPRVHCLEERSKAKVVENYQYTSAPMVIRLKLLFAQLFPSISSVSTEQSQICVKNTKIAM